MQLRETLRPGAQGRQEMLEDLLQPDTQGEIAEANTGAA